MRLALTALLLAACDVGVAANPSPPDLAHGNQAVEDLAVRDAAPPDLVDLSTRFAQCQTLMAPAPLPLYCGDGWVECSFGNYPRWCRAPGASCYTQDNCQLDHMIKPNAICHDGTCCKVAGAKCQASAECCSGSCAIQSCE